MPRSWISSTMTLGQMTEIVSEIPALSKTMQGDDMLQAEEVAAMVRLHGLGWGAKRLSQEFGCARNTVRRYLRAGGPVAYRKPERRTAFDGLEDWLRERFFRLARPRLIAKP